MSKIIYITPKPPAKDWEEHHYFKFGEIYWIYYRNLDEAFVLRQDGIFTMTIWSDHHWIYTWEKWFDEVKF